MLKQISKLFLVASVSTIGMMAADNSIGTWKRNIEKTTYDAKNPPLNPIVSQTIVREAVEGGVRVSSTGKRKDGTEIKTSGTVKYDGKPHSVAGSGSMFDTAITTQIDANTFTSEAMKKGGKYHTSGKTVISKDGKTMTSTQTGTDDQGKPISFTVVYDKQ